MRQEKTFLEQELELERERKTECSKRSLLDRIRRWFVKDPVFEFTDWDELERTRAEKRRDAIEDELAKCRGTFINYGVTADEFTEAIHKAMTDQNHLTEYVWDTISDNPSIANTVICKGLAEESAASHARVQAMVYDRMLRDAIEQMQKYGGNNKC